VNKIVWVKENDVKNDVDDRNVAEQFDDLSGDDHDEE
jgi:hypothetical protein